MNGRPTLGCFDAVRGPIAWRPFEPAVFDAAAATGTPVFLVVGAAWCPYSQRLLHWLQNDPGVVTALARAWLPVLVDGELRPDVYAAYQAAGWPTVALLDPAGDPVWRGTHIPRRQLAAVLHDMARVAAMGMRARGQVDVTDDSSRPVIATAIRMALDDESNGGTGTRVAPRFPHFDAIEFLLHGDAADRSVGLRALRARLAHLWHNGDGGLCRQASGPGWSGVHRAKLLDDQAALIHALSSAIERTAADDLRAPLRAAIDWCHACLGGDAGFAASIRPDHPDVPSAWPVPTVDRRRFVAGNAAMVSALFKAAAVLDDDALRERALSVLDILTSPRNGGACIVQSRGLVDDGPLLLALADTLDTDAAVWRSRADALADACLARQGDPRAPGAAAPRAGGPARMQRLPTDLRAAAVFAEALHRVAAGDAARRRRARRALQALTPAARRAGLAGARVALARRRLGLPDA